MKGKRKGFVLLAGVACGMLLAWLIQPWIAPPYTARARVLGPQESYRELNQHLHEWIRPVFQAHPHAGETRTEWSLNPRTDGMEITFTAQDPELPMAVVNELVARMSDGNVEVKIVAAPKPDRFPDPNLALVGLGGCLGLLAAFWKTRPSGTAYSEGA